MTDATKRLGYGGSATIDGIQVIVNSGGISESITRPFSNMLDIPPPTNVPDYHPTRSKVLHSEGTKVSTVSVAFDVTSTSIALLAAAKLLQRGYIFDVGIYDGEVGKTLSNCRMTSLSVSGAPAGLISCSLQATAPGEASPTIDSTSVGSVTHNFIRDEEPYGYWFSGAVDIRDWSFSVSQDVQPLYTNYDSMWPKYLRVGLWGMTLDAVTYDRLREHDTVRIATRLMALTGTTRERGYSFTGVTDLGNYSHSFETGATMTYGGGGSDSTIITIT